MAQVIIRRPAGDGMYAMMVLSPQVRTKPTVCFKGRMHVKQTVSLKQLALF